MEEHYTLYWIAGVFVLLVLYYNSKNEYIPTKPDYEMILTVDQAPKPKEGDLVDGLKARTWLELDEYGNRALFVGGKAGVPDALLFPKGDQMINVIDQVPILSSTAATYAALAVDIDHNGHSDLLVAREDGVTLYKNYGKTNFKAQKILNGSIRTIPISLAVTDYNKDGHVDIYVSQHTHPKYLAENPNYIAKNILLEGVGPGVFEDVTTRTHTSGTNDIGDGTKNGTSTRTSTTKSANWVDLDNDTLPDLVLRQENGSQEIYRNMRAASGAKYTSGPHFAPMRIQGALGTMTDAEAASLDRPDPTMQLLADQPSKRHRTQIILRQGRDITGVPMLYNATGNYSQINGTSQTGGGSSLTGSHRILPPYRMQITEDLDHSWAVSAGQPGDLPGGELKVEPGDDLYWLNISAQQNVRSDGKNFIGVRVPNSTPFLNASVHVASINDHTGKIRRQTKQITNSSNSPTGNVIFFQLGDDNRLIHVEVNTIYHNHWAHPNPKINTIATFRNMRSNVYTARSISDTPPRINIYQESLMAPLK